MKKEVHCYKRNSKYSCNHFKLLTRWWILITMRRNALSQALSSAFLSYS